MRIIMRVHSQRRQPFLADFHGNAAPASGDVADDKSRRGGALHRLRLSRPGASAITGMEVVREFIPATAG
ncbi:hypothetical protein V1227_12945 [Lentzea sp. DG1S-22]|uniref:hypothetical protein n=1 Tax=Lentzea sp. DG1S-22 TaxID=3108822 RepID=UPI002E76D4BA|nr:hypothetical protein [Lentzea sp. DG1S-22]WVH83612.1 hypothetical protein V1227_12945 [Lentzea sp. DG1S-22]